MNIMRKSKSLPVNLNNYKHTIKKSNSFNELILPVEKKRTIIKTFEFRGTEELGICFKDLDEKIIIDDLIGDKIALITDICIGMELIAINNNNLSLINFWNRKSNFNKIMNDIGKKYKKNKYISFTFKRIIYDKKPSEVFEIED